MNILLSQAGLMFEYFGLILKNLCWGLDFGISEFPIQFNLIKDARDCTLNEYQRLNYIETFPILSHATLYVKHKAPYVKCKNHCLRRKQRKRTSCEIQHFLLHEFARPYHPRALPEGDAAWQTSAIKMLYLTGGVFYIYPISF